MSVVFPRQTLTEDTNPLPAGNLLSGMFGGGGETRGRSNLRPIITIIIRITIIITITLTAKNNNKAKNNNDDNDGENNNANNNIVMMIMTTMI